MSGVVVIRSLLVASAPLIAVVPEAKIVAEALPQDTALPALSVQTISSVDRKVLKKGVKRRVTERVQVMIHARDSTERLRLVGLVRAAAASQIGDFAGLTEVSVQTDGQGPDFTNETGMRLRAQDFMVSFNELA